MEENDAKNRLIVNYWQLSKRSEITHALQLSPVCRKCWIIFRGNTPICLEISKSTFEVMDVLLNSNRVFSLMTHFDSSHQLIWYYKEHHHRKGPIDGINGIVKNLVRKKISGADQNNDVVQQEFLKIAEQLYLQRLGGLVLLLLLLQLLKPVWHSSILIYLLI